MKGAHREPRGLRALPYLPAEKDHLALGGAWEPGRFTPRASQKKKEKTVRTKCCKDVEDLERIHCWRECKITLGNNLSFLYK